MTDSCRGASSMRRAKMSRSRRRFGLMAVMMAITVASTLPRSCSCFVGAVPPSSMSSRKKTTTPPNMVASTLETPGTTRTTIKFKPSSVREQQPSGWRMVQRRLGLLSTKQQQELDYQRRKEEWAARYTHIDSLRETFGSNRNKVWGDLDAPTARRLYKTLLPRALLELYDVGIKSEDLAPLAYKARVAAKLYARERCQVPSRYAAMAIDGFRQWKRYGKFQPKGMSYDQVWTKYEQQIIAELESEDDLTDQDVTAKICLKILERSCKTNSRIDKWILKDGEEGALEQHLDLVAIANQLERDVRELLNPKEPVAQRRRSIPARRVFTLRLVARAKRRLARQQKITPTNQANNKILQDHEGMPVQDKASSVKHPWDERTNKINNRKRAWQERKRPSRTL